MTMTRLFALCLVLNVMSGAAAAKEPVLPAGFVHLRNVAPTIVQDMRYAGAFNFTGARVPGYRAAECILWRPAAAALARAQERLKAEGFLLKVYDCYRPVQAVRAFAWSRGAGGDAMKPIFYPAFDKSQLLRSDTSPRSHIIHWGSPLISASSPQATPIYRRRRRRAPAMARSPSGQRNQASISTLSRLLFAKKRDPESVDIRGGPREPQSACSRARRRRLPQLSEGMVALRLCRRICADQVSRLYRQ